MSNNYSDRTTLSAALPDDKINQLAYRNTLGHNNWEALYSQLQTATAQRDSLQKDSLVLKFRALAYLYPATCNKMASILILAPHSSFTFKVLKNALETAEITIAKNALVNVAKARKKEEDVMIDLLPVFATTVAPTEEMIDFVKEMASDTTNSGAVIGTSQLALGGIAYHLKKLDIKRSTAICQFIVDKLRNEKDTMQKC